MNARLAAGLAAAGLALALAACGGKPKEPKVDAAAERQQATERAREGPFGTQVKALETAKGLGADLNQKAIDEVDRAERGAK